MIFLALLFTVALAAAVLWAEKPAFNTADWVFVWIVLVVAIIAKIYINSASTY